MNKRKYCFLLLLSSMLISCGNQTSSSNSFSNTNTPSEVLITPPAYDEPSISIHYSRSDKNYDKWALWLWAKSKDGKEYFFNGQDSYGAIAAYKLSDFGTDVKEIGFIVKSKGSWSNKDVGTDRFIKLSDFTADDKKIYNIYLKQNDVNLYVNETDVLSTISMAKFTEDSKVAVETNVPMKQVEILENGKSLKVESVANQNKKVTITLPNPEKVSVLNDYKVKVTFANDTTAESSVSVSSLYNTESFKSKYTYQGDDLGANYTSSATTFKVWSPVSSKIVLNVYNSGTPTASETKYHTQEMIKNENGVFELTVNGDLANKYYTYSVTNSKFEDMEVVDPYAKSAGLNGIRGMIVDFAKTNPEGWDDITPLAIDRKALVVYETHVSDITSSTTWTGTKENKKKFLGMIEEGTTYNYEDPENPENNKVVKTGFDHIKELGVNAVQLVPIFDQANEESKMTFNWGYNPLNYNVLEGSYSSNPSDGNVRINEFKQLVMAYNKAGMNIIMDVVYNHVSGAVGSNFDVLMPGYYFRYDASGNLSNGSGCGNETASEMPMMRKFMVDSIKFWTKEYKLGGYRFDLMGLHDLDTMELLTKEAKNINNNIVVYGEPWTGGTTPLSDSINAKQNNGNKYVGFGQFNDQMRDALIKGGLNSSSAKGWITDNKKAINNQDQTSLLSGIKGITKSNSVEISDPDKTVNYVTCHDNYTLFDRIVASGIEKKDIDTIKKMAVLANSVVLTSQGTTFILAGEELLRSKNGNSNSYNSSYIVNEINYKRKAMYYDVFTNYKKLIEFKKNTSGLHLDKNNIQQVNVIMNNEKSMLSYFINDNEQNRQYIIIHANGLANGLTYNLDGYTLYHDTLSETKELNSSTPILPYETIIAYKSK